MRSRRILLLIALQMLSIPGVAHTQSASPERELAPEFQSDSDPTRPVFISIRPEFSSIDEGISQRTLIVRYDAAALLARRVLGGLPGVIMRFEVPFIGADVGADHRSGLGDAYGQFFVMPYAKGGFVWAVGSGALFPTAGSDLLGSGKLVLAPVVAPLWRFPGGMFFVKVQNFTSVAGSSARHDINHLLVTPLFVHVLPHYWWVLVDSETKTNWMRDGRTGVKSGLQIGRRLAPGVGFWVKPEAWWGPNRDARWNVKFGIVWYQRRSSPNSHSDSAAAIAP